jgi:signal transduction histidine kinase
VEVSPELGTIVLDPVRLKQILYNLLSNAVKFTDDQGRVDVRAVPQDDHRFALTVRDTGVGIAPEDLPRLFREFEQLDAGPGRRYEGSGLGLSLTKRLVERHGGTVDVASELGHGTLITVMLPRVAVPAPTSAAVSTAPAPVDELPVRPPTEIA